jgi:polyhydroxybutyrate depolymerase
VNGSSRKYDLFVPPGATATAPLSLVFVLHADTSVSLRPYFPIEAASAGHAIVVYPYGLDGWDLSAPDDNVDFPFITALKDSLESSLCIDKSRVFAYGYSQGGFFAHMLACYRGPDLFRAISVNSGGLYAPDGAPANYDDNGLLLCPKPPVGVMIIHGTSDNQVSYQDNGVYSRDSWLKMNQCDDTTAPFDPSPCVKYSQCATNSVAFCSIAMGHTIWTKAATASWNYFSSF